MTAPALDDFDVDAVLLEARRRYAKLPPEERERHRAAREHARIAAARFLLTSGRAEDRRLAARFIFGMTRRAA